MKKLLANSFLLMFLFGMLITPVASVSLLKVQNDQEVLSAHSRKTVEVEDNKDNQPIYYDIRNNAEETTQSTQNIN